MKGQAISPEKPKCRLDDINMRILDVLTENSRITMTELAARVWLTRPAVDRRVKRMEALNIIKRFTAVIDWDKIELDPDRGDGNGI